MIRMLRISRKWTAVEPYFGDVVSDQSRRTYLFDAINIVLRTRRIDPALHDAIEQEMVEQSKCRDMIARLYHLEMLKRLEDFEHNPNRQGAWWLVGPFASNDRLLIVDWYNLVIRCSRRPYSDVTEELDCADAELRRIMDNVMRKLPP